MGQFKQQNTKSFFCFRISLDSPLHSFDLAMLEKAALKLLILFPTALVTGGPLRVLAKKTRFSKTHQWTPAEILSPQQDTLNICNRNGTTASSVCDPDRVLSRGGRDNIEHLIYFWYVFILLFYYLHRILTFEANEKMGHSSWRR